MKTGVVLACLVVIGQTLDGQFFTGSGNTFKERRDVELFCPAFKAGLSRAADGGFFADCKVGLRRAGRCDGFADFLAVSRKFGKLV